MARFKAAFLGQDNNKPSKRTSIAVLCRYEAKQGHASFLPKFPQFRRNDWIPKVSSAMSPMAVPLPRSGDSQTLGVYPIGVAEKGIPYQEFIVSARFSNTGRGLWFSL